MPLTFSHPAAVLPLLALPLVPSALVIGSMTPDLPYYIPGNPISSRRTHSLAGVVTLDLVLGVVAFALWHGLLAPLLLALAPAPVRDRLEPLRAHGRSLRSAAVVLVSLAAGAATHVVWDAFTHPDRWGSDRIAWLREEHGPFAGHTWAQYGTGALGLLALALAVARWWRRTPPRPGRHTIPPLPRAAVVRALALVVAAGAVGAVAGLATADGTLFGLAFRGLTWGCGAGAAALLVLAAAQRAR